MISDQRDSALPGRAAECRALEHLVDTVRSGASEVVVLLGEAGIGKTALLDHLRDCAAGFTVLTAAGVESDMELAFAGLQQLCAPVLHHRFGLPSPQRQALEQAFGLGDGNAPPNRFLVGLAVVGLLAAAASEQPVLCVIDDVHWLDHVSAQTLFFVARRLQAESVGVAFASRTPIEGTAGLPTLTVTGLSDTDARALLESVLPGRVDPAVLDRIVAESRGNPLALSQTPVFAETYPVTHRAPAQPVSAGIEAHYQRVLEALPDQTRTALLVAAADVVGDPALLRRALAQLEIGPAALTPALDAGLIHLDTRAQFHHPLARSVAYRIAAGEQRRRAHGALAAATDPDVDPDRRAWHRALAAEQADEQVAGDLERSAGRARQRGGTAAVAAFLGRAVELTPDPALRSSRALVAAEAHWEIASFDLARRLLATAELGPVTALQRARLAQLRTRVDFADARSSGDATALREAVTRFTSVARELEPLDAALATETYLEALTAAMYVGRGGGTLSTEMATQARTALAHLPPRTPLDLVTHAFADRLALGPVAAMPAMRRALEAVIESTRTGRGWFWQAFPLAHDCLVHETFDDRWPVIADHAVAAATESGTLAPLPAALLSRAGALSENGELTTATAVVAEANDLSMAISYVPLKYHGLLVAAWKGDQAEVTRLAAAATETGEARGESRVIGLAHYAIAVVNNATGRYHDALAATRSGLEYDDLGFYNELLVESVEAAVRCDNRQYAETCLAQLRERAEAAGTPRALGALKRSQALLSAGPRAQELYRESLAHFGSTAQRMNLARVWLLYGEWLRRNGPVTVAREPLRTAHREFLAMGSAAFAERARRELQASGQKTRKQPTAAGEELSPQEQQIAELAGQGLTNQEIAGQLFISAHTVEWHLRKVFTKLGIRSRRDLRTKLNSGRAK